MSNFELTNLTIESLEINIKKEILKEVLNSNGDFDLMSLDKLKMLFAELINIKSDNFKTKSLEEALNEDFINMEAIEKRMNDARIRLKNE